MTTMDLIATVSNNSPVLAADPTRKRFLALANRVDGPDFSCGLHVSGDEGRSWVSVNPVPTLPPGADKCYAPEVAFDRTGRLHYLFVGLANPGNTPMGAFITTSTDGGQSFTPPLQILGPRRYQVRMAIDRDEGSRGRIHLVWLEARSDPPTGGFSPSSPNPIMAAHSDDGGRTFSTPVQVSDPRRPLAVGPALALGPDRRVHVLYYDLQEDVRDYQGLEGPTWEGRWSVVLATSTDGGLHFGEGVEVDGDLIPPERVMLIFTMAPPALVVDRAGRIYAAWHDARNGDWDVFLRVSVDGGRTWGRLRRLNDDPIGNGRHQYLPRLSLAGSGRLDAIFYDRRNDEANRGNDVFYTYSPDAGRRFARNTQLTSQGSDSRIGPRYAVTSAQGLFEFGGRIALFSADRSVTAAWTDTRNTGRGAPAQDILATRIDLPGMGKAPSWPRRTGVALAAGGFGLLVWWWRRARPVARGGPS